MERMLFISLFFAFSAYAARVGMALADLGYKIWSFTLLGYLFMFTIASALIKIYNNLFLSNLYIFKYAIYFHFIVALGLIIWSIFLWEERRSPYLLLLPCPFCVATVFFSLMVFVKIINWSLYELTFIAYIIFASTVTIFMVLARLFKVSSRDVMLAAGMFYTFMLISSAYYKQAQRIYMLSIKNYMSFPKYAVFVILLLAGFVVSGFVRGVLK